MIKVSKSERDELWLLQVSYRKERVKCGTKKKKKQLDTFKLRSGVFFNNHRNAFGILVTENKADEQNSSQKGTNRYWRALALRSSREYFFLNEEVCPILKFGARQE